MQITNAIEYLSGIMSKYFIILKRSKSIQKLPNTPLVHVLHINMDFIYFFFILHSRVETAVVILNNIRVLNFSEKLNLTEGIK